MTTHAPGRATRSSTVLIGSVHHLRFSGISMRPAITPQGGIVETRLWTGKTDGTPQLSLVGRLRSVAGGPGFAGGWPPPGSIACILPETRTAERLPYLAQRFAKHWSAAGGASCRRAPRRRPGQRVPLPAICLRPCAPDWTPSLKTSTPKPDFPHHKPTEGRALSWARFANASISHRAASP